jgi:hypothetical protein
MKPFHQHIRKKSLLLQVVRLLERLAVQLVEHLQLQNRQRFHSPLREKYPLNLQALEEYVLYIISF